MKRFLAITGVVLALGGCWNGENMNIRMGDVSLGQQLIDLKRALDEGAIDKAEYERLKVQLMATADLCGEGGSGDD
ncbi:MAG: SHOCT domain-containing protein [Pseudomonadales bacterium]|jgi:hypothetical protein|nr:SHOCT domain-containing protein [Pseudomonadales bacterium]